MAPAAGTSGKPRFPQGRDPRKGARLVVIGLGANVDAAANIQRAVEELSYAFHLLVKSTRYVGPPEGDGPAAHPGAPDTFSNAAVLVRTADTHDQIRAKAKAIEAAMGRDRSDPSVVTIDLDILLIQDEVVRDGEGRIVVPHPDLETRRHAAIPGAEVAPFLRHPRTKEAIAEMAARLA